MTDNEKRCYMNGYNAGRRRAWPLHKPPLPPEGHLKQLMQALLELRDGVDAELAVLEGDEMVRRLGPLVDQADTALTQIGEWLTQITEVSK